jgi:hypothetical protein
MSAKRTITSVKIPDNLYEDFKIINVRTKMNLQDLVERSIFLYLTQDDFRKIVHEQYNTYYTGSETLNKIGK